MRWTCWFFGVVLAVASIGPLGLGVAVALGSDRTPSRTISQFELHRAELARDYVEGEAKNRGRLPTYVEFQPWKAHASPDLRVDGQGFDYWPERGEITFGWWDGDAFVSWHPARDRGLVLISPKSVFFFGSKLADLLALFGSAAIMLVAAWGFTSWARGAGAHAS